MRAGSTSLLLFLPTAPSGFPTDGGGVGGGCHFLPLYTSFSVPQMSQHLAAHPLPTPTPPTPPLRSTSRNLHVFRQQLKVSSSPTSLAGVENEGWVCTDAAAAQQDQKKKTTQKKQCTRLILAVRSYTSEIRAKAF